LAEENRWQCHVTVVEFGDPLCAVGRGEQIAVFVCDGCAIWISKCAIQVELRCERFARSLLVIVVFESEIILANKLQLDSRRGKAIV